MGRLGINEWDVEQAVQQLKMQGKNPTIDSIREVLGRGSKTTISRHFHSIKNQFQNERLMEHVLPEQLAQAVHQLWVKLNEMASLRIHEMEEQTNQKEAAYEERIRALTLEKNDYFAKLNQELQKTIQLSQELKTCRETLSDTEARFGRVEHELELQKTVLEDSKSENKRLHELAKHIQENLEHYQEAVQRQRTEYMLQTEQLQQTWRLQLDDLEEKNKSAQEKITEQNQHAVVLNARLEHLSAEKNTLFDQWQRSEKLFNQEKTNLAEQKAREQELKKILAEQKESESKSIQQCMRLEKELAVSIHEVNQHKERVRVLEDQERALKDENRFLMQEKFELQGQIKHMEEAYLRFTKSKEHA